MILVTGASGHLGRPLVAKLIENGEKVRTLSMDKEAKLPGVEVVPGDLLDLPTVQKAAEGADVIYHLAAIVDYRSAPRKLMYTVNVLGTKNILEASKAKKFIYMSSTAVYGKRPRDDPATESTPYHPSSYYGQTKAMAEKLVLEKGGLVLRAPVIYGPGFNDGFDFVLSQIQKGKMRIIGDGKNLIQWINIGDLIQALVLAKDRGRGGEAYLVAGGERKTQEELFSLLAKYLDVPPPSRKVSPLLANALAYCKLLQAKLGGKTPKVTPDQMARIASSRTFDISKATAELGFRPAIGYEDGANEIVSEYLQKAAWQ